MTWLKGRKRFVPEPSKQDLFQKKLSTRFLFNL